MKNFNKNDYHKIETILKWLPIEIVVMYMENTTIYFECTTKWLHFVFDIVVQDYARLSFDTGMYWWDENLILCDFRNDLEKGSFWEDYNTWNIEIDVENFFEDNFEELYQYMVYDKNIINTNEYQEEYNITVDNLLYLLKADNHIFKEINKWHSNCYAVSEAIYKYIDIDWLELVYWKWNWFISADSSFDKWISNHGWLEFRLWKSTIVIDPTRWVFEWVEPYIYINMISSEYDRAAQKFQAMIRWNKVTSIPKPEVNDKIKEISFWKEIDDFLFNNLLKWKYNYYTVRNIMYIANTPVVDLKPYEKEILEILEEEWFDAFIPIDTKELVFWYNSTSWNQHC